MKVIITGATGMVGEGVMLACLEDDRVKEILSISRKPCGHAHAKLRELLVADFMQIENYTGQLMGYDACFYCAGVSSVGMDEATFTRNIYDTTLHVAKVLKSANPNMVFNFVSGRSTDSTENGKIMWARVKGKTENDLMKLGFKKQFNFRPALMNPMPGQVHFKGYNGTVKFLYPVLSLFFPAMHLKDVAKAMVNTVDYDYPKQVLENEDMKALAAKG